MKTILHNKVEDTIDTLAKIQCERGFHPAWIVKHFSSLAIQLNLIEWNYLASKVGYDLDWARQQYHSQYLNFSKHK
jgi:hypothetical protein